MYQKKFLFSTAAFTLMASMALATPAPSDRGTHIECVMLEKCSSGECAKISPKPILLRILQLGDKRHIMVYGSSDLIGAPPESENGISSLFGWNISGGLSYIATDVSNGMKKGQMWVDLRAPSGAQQTLKIGEIDTSLDRVECETSAKLTPRNILESVGDLENGYVGMCRVREDVCQWALKQNNDGD
ncbi:hypothetical protein [Sulfitobacter sp.]|uniref:hypothetical protein n=1 Tax=Sulfitobacter sp. TaxID=1903071 RepID=UPI00300342E5